MSPLVPLATFGWFPITMVLFAIFPPRRAVVVALVAGWLFLPVVPAGLFKISGIPAYDKSLAVTLPILIGMLCFDTHRFLSFRPKWWDASMLVLFASAVAASLSNGRGWYDGLSAASMLITTWGLPYFIGRICFDDLESLKELAIGVAIGGLVYIPCCLAEIRLSPQMHNAIYGFHQHSFLQHIRGGSYRPMVFMAHGLMVGFWMAAATIVCAAGWRSGAMRTVAGISSLWVLVVLAVTTILCKAVFAIGLMVVGLVIILIMRRIWAILLLLAMIPSYIVVRVYGVIPREAIVSSVEGFAAPDRVQSLEARLIQEDLFSAKALERPWFGWTGWDFFPVDEEGKNMTRGVDPLWIIMLGTKGVVGLASFLLVFLLPVMLFMRRYPVRYWRRPDVAMAAALALVVLLWMCDSLLNGHPTPIYTVAAGGLAAATGLPGRRERTAELAIRAKQVARVSRVEARWVMAGGTRRRGGDVRTAGEET